MTDTAEPPTIQQSLFPSYFVYPLTPHARNWRESSVRRYANNNIVLRNVKPLNTLIEWVIIFVCYVDCSQVVDTGLGIETSTRSVFVYLIGTDDIDDIEVRLEGPELRLSLSSSSSALLFLRSCCVYRNLFHSSPRGCPKCCKKNSM